MTKQIIEVGDRVKCNHSEDMDRIDRVIEIRNGIDTLEYVIRKPNGQIYTAHECILEKLVYEKKS